MLLWWIALLCAARSFTAADDTGKQFLEAKAQEEGVVSLKSGLLYKVLRKGHGKFHPKFKTACDCHYKGRLISGEEFDSSYEYDTPVTFAPNQVIKGWAEAMQLMVEGDHWELYIPPKLAYGEAGAGEKIPANAVLVFQTELVKIRGPRKKAKARIKAERVEKLRQRPKPKVPAADQPESYKNISEAYRCQVCYAAAYQLGVQLQAENETLSCGKDGKMFGSYGQTSIDDIDVRRLTGPGLGDGEACEAPGQWPIRIQALCNELLEEIEEGKIREMWGRNASASGLQQELCVADCSEDGRKRLPPKPKKREAIWSWEKPKTTTTTTTTTEPEFKVVNMQAKEVKKVRSNNKFVCAMTCSASMKACKGYQEKFELAARAAKKRKGGDALSKAIRKIPFIFIDVDKEAQDSEYGKVRKPRAVLYQKGYGEARALYTYHLDEHEGYARWLDEVLKKFLKDYKKDRSMYM